MKLYFSRNPNPRLAVAVARYLAFCHLMMSLDCHWMAIRLSAAGIAASNRSMRGAIPFGGWTRPSCRRSLARAHDIDATLLAAGCRRAAAFEDGRAARYRASSRTPPR